MKIGIIVGRFQVAELHQGHKDLIDCAISECDQVMVVLGSPRSMPTELNPLSYEMRAQMIRRQYPDVRLAMLSDCPSDDDWSRELDKLVLSKFPACEVLLYGSRDSFFSVYSGELPERYFEPKNDCSGTACRAQFSDSQPMTADFRAGVIYRETSRHPVVYPTVDVAVIRNDRQEVLLAGKKHLGDKLWFIGGFVDTADESLESAAKREVAEETSSTEIGDLTYVGSVKVRDWRYQNCKDAITTTFFRTTYVFGPAKPSDDIDTLTWIPLAKLMDVLSSEHKPLGSMLLKSLGM